MALALDWQMDYQIFRIKQKKQQIGICNGRCVEYKRTFQKGEKVVGQYFTLIIAVVGHQKNRAAQKIAEIDERNVERHVQERFGKACATISENLYLLHLSIVIIAAVQSKPMQ